MTRLLDPDWEPPNPPDKVLLPEPVRFFTVTEIRDDKDDLGWKYLGKCKPRATCCGSRFLLRFPDGSSRVVRIGGITGISIIVCKPRPVPDVPLGTEVYLLETEESDYPALVHGDTRPLPIFSPIKNPVDREWRRKLRANVDSELEMLPPSLARELVTGSRTTHPARLTDGYWVVYDLPNGLRVLLRPDDASYCVETLEGQRGNCRDLSAVLAHIGG
ncbi:MAG: hypothetical protein HY289_04980 [Planctomycetes bacterium]|nr:hypothetical protein [Planctomycetota bacterium]